MCSCWDLSTQAGAGRAAGDRCNTRQEQAVVIAHAGLLALLVAVLGGLGGVGLTYLWSLGSPVYYGIKIDWGVPELSLRTGVGRRDRARPGCGLHPVIHSGRLERRGTAKH